MFTWTMIKLYNTLKRKKETFKPLSDKKVNMFVCGVTTYDHAHIGHAKTIIQFEFIVNYLRYRGYNVSYLQNITDIDDKIIHRAKELKKTPKELAKKYEKSFMEDIKALKVKSVSKYARATDHIKEIVSQIQRLKQKGVAYEIKDDGIYFNLKKFKDYGKLSGRTTLEAEDAVTRIDESIHKKNKGDFALWKFSKKDEPSWQTDLGKGRPGWHIEDTAITEKYLGQQYDIHGGARDLIFPHHEAEIAQMESIGKKPLVKYWLHTGFLNVKGQKMSKSLGNFITVKDLLNKYSAEEIRYFFMTAHYRSPINFSYELMDQHKKTLQSINDFVLRCKGKEDKVSENFIEKIKKQFIKAMDNDFDTVKALAILHDFMHQVNIKGGGKKVYNFMQEINKIFDILALKQEKTPKLIQELVDDREKARRDKNFSKADKIRNILKQKGYLVEDTQEGPRIKKNE